MKYNKTIIAAVILGCSMNAFAGQIDGSAVVGSMLGAGVGSAIGSASGGKEGAIIGGGVGGALGAAVGSNQGTARSSTQVVSQERVIYVEEDNDRRHKRHKHRDQGNHYGEYKHGRD
ncbi:glycine zipper domain-containing protein [Sulfuricurvum sp.]|uniref:glycine zipper domain-containing protein n=1 Tax=Sulfuricurvum sp. TaxID=2025608 RepID=UPI003BB13C0D